MHQMEVFPAKERSEGPEPTISLPGCFWGYSPSMTSLKRLTIRSSRRVELIDITAQVEAAIAKDGPREGLCVLQSAHTTAGLTVNENADPDVRRDLERHLAALVPVDAGFAHAEGNSDAHIKTSLVGASVSLVVHEGRLLLGRWQGVYLCEFDGPRERTVYVRCVADD